MEASGHARWFERMLAELNMELWVGDAHLLSLSSQVAIKLYRSLAVFQLLLSAIFSFSIHKRNLLEARLIIASIMVIVRLLSIRAFLVGFGSTKSTRAREPALLWNQ
jgi:hypothetical protein